MSIQAHVLFKMADWIQNRFKFLFCSLIRKNIHFYAMIFITITLFIFYYIIYYIFYSQPWEPFKIKHIKKLRTIKKSNNSPSRTSTIPLFHNARFFNVIEPCCRFPDVLLRRTLANLGWPWRTFVDLRRTFKNVPNKKQLKKFGKKRLITIKTFLEQS